MTCRDAVLAAFARLERRHNRQDFDLAEVVQEVLSHTADYEESTIRTHTASWMCAQAPVNRGFTTAELERVARGRYRRRK